MFIYVKTAFFADLVKKINTSAVFIIVGSVYLDDSVNALSAAVYKHSDRKFKFSHHGVLLFYRHTVAFNKSIAVVCYILILYALAVKRIEADPRSGFFLVVAKHRTNVAVTFAKPLDKLPCRPVTAPLCGQIPGLAVLFCFPRLRNIAHVLPCLKECFKICDYLLDRIPLGRLGDRYALTAVYKGTAFFCNYLAVPIVCLKLMGAVSSFLCHLHDSSCGHGLSIAVKALPLVFTLTAVITAV